MTDIETLAALLLEPFRIVLLAGLLVTMVRTEAATGRWLPLATGAVFVAVLIPTTMGPPAGVDPVRAAILGLVANAIILTVLLALLAGWQRLRR